MTYQLYFRTSLFLLLLAGCALSPPKGGYLNIMSEHNEMLAQINPETEEIKYFGNPNKALLRLVEMIRQQQVAAEQARLAATPKPEAKKK